jgi:hypothetical protein
MLSWTEEEGGEAIKRQKKIAAETAFETAVHDGVPAETYCVPLSMCLPGR